MKKAEFRSYLKSRGKKDHVIDGLIHHVTEFEKHLQNASSKSLDQASSKDLQQFIEIAEKWQSGLAKKYCRGIALYYKFIDSQLHLTASKYRESAISKTRRNFPLKKLQRMNKNHIESLAAIGIKDTMQMLEACKTPSLRKKLARLTGIPQASILELTKLSDLTRLRAVKEVRARLYYDAGVDTVEKMARWNPEELGEFIEDFIKSSGFLGVSPQPKEIKSTIAEAGKLKSVIQY
jgi:hypothetical protein